MFIEEIKSTRCAIRLRGAPLAPAGGMEHITAITFGGSRSLAPYIAHPQIFVKMISEKRQDLEGRPKASPAPQNQDLVVRMIFAQTFPSPVVRRGDPW